MIFFGTSSANVEFSCHIFTLNLAFHKWHQMHLALMNRQDNKATTKASERGGGRGEIPEAPTGYGPEILVKCLVMAATVKRVGDPQCVIACFSWGATLGSRQSWQLHN